MIFEAMKRNAVAIAWTQAQARIRARAMAAMTMLALATVVVDAGAAPPVPIANPINVGVMDAGGIGDPEIIKFRGKYYLYSSNNNYSGGAYSDRVLVWESTDLTNWAYRGVAADYAQGWLNWAPDVLYYNGQFYMVTGGDTLAGGRAADPYYPALPAYYRDHVVMRSDSPTGPFVKIGDNLPGSIDGHIFQDDDGKLYFFWAAVGGIRYRPLTAPNTVDAAQAERQLTACSVNIAGSWTEAPMVWKRNGTYYLSYSGNDLMRDDYQVHVCKGSTLASMTPQANKVLSLDLAGQWRSSAHSTMIMGPDLVTPYNAYHERDTFQPGLYRRLGLSEGWIASDGQLRADPPENGFNRPSQPAFRDDFNRAAIGTDWQQYGNAPWGIFNGELMWNDSSNYSGWNLQITRTRTSLADYVYEGSAKHFGWGSLAVSPYPKYGIVSSVVKDGAGNVVSAFFFGVDARNNLLVSWAVVNGVDMGWQNTAMPAGWNHNAWHALRIEKRGAAFKLYYDDMLKQTRSVALDGGGFGVGADNTHVDFSSLAMNHNINGWYRITPRIAPDKAVEVGGWSMLNGGNAIQWTFGGSQANQLWWGQSRGGTGGVSFTNKNSGKVLEVAGVLTASGANVQQWDDVRGGNQTWLPESAGGPWWSFRPNHATGQCLDISAGNPANGANVQQWACNGLAPQQFSLTAY